MDRGTAPTNEQWRTDAEEFEWLWSLDLAGGVLSDASHADDATRIARTWARLRLRHGPLSGEDLEDILEDIAGDIDAWWKRGS